MNADAKNAKLLEAFNVKNYYFSGIYLFITIIFSLSVFDCNAHHNFGLYYDSSKIVTITGIVKNTHTLIRI